MVRCAPAPPGSLFAVAEPGRSLAETSTCNIDWHVWNLVCRPEKISAGEHLGCYMEKATEARHRLERQYNACANRKKQCRPNETKPYSNATHQRKRQNNPTNGHTPGRIKSTHTRLAYTGMRPHAPGHKAGDHPVPAHATRKHHTTPRIQLTGRSMLLASALQEFPAGRSGCSLCAPGPRLLWQRGAPRRLPRRD